MTLAAIEAATQQVHHADATATRARTERARAIREARDAGIRMSLIIQASGMSATTVYRALAEN